MRSHEGLYTKVTPSMAEEILTRNTVNRPLRSGVAEKYARDMRAGEWEKNGEAVKIAEDGTLLDGQHRLWAVIYSGLKYVELLVLTDLPMSAIRTIDTGTPRNYADYRRISGNAEGRTIKNPRMLQATARWLRWYENEWPALSLGKLPYTNAELDETANGHSGLLDAVDAATRTNKLRRLGYGQSIAGVYCLAREHNPDLADRWLQQLETGEGEPDSAAITLRERLIAAKLSGQKLTSMRAAVYIIKSWNAFAEGDPLKHFKWQDEELVPGVYGTDKYHKKQSVAKRVAAAKDKALHGRVRTGMQTRKRRPKRDHV